MCAAMDLPNVRPGALSGTMQPFGAEPLPDETVETEQQQGIMVPAGDIDSRIAWVAAGETDDERRQRADAVWQHEVDTGAPQHELDELSGLLTDAVYDHGDLLGGFNPAEPGDVDLPPAGDSLSAQQPQVQSVGVEGIAPTTTVGDIGANPGSESLADQGATGEPPATSEAESAADSAPSDADTADASPAADGQNSTSSSDD